MQEYTPEPAPEPIQTKRCSKCREWKPATTEYFCRATEMACGLKSQCKQCQREWRIANAEKEKERSRKYRAEHPDKASAATRKYRSAHKEERVEYQRKYKEANPGKATEASRKSRAANPERARRLGREWAAANRQKTRESSRKHYLAHKEDKAEWQKEYKRAHPDRRRAIQHKYAIANREKSRVKTSEYRARKRNLPGSFTAADWLRALDYFNGCCAVCERPMNGLFHEAHADHWIALSDPNCPGTVPSNMIPLCGGSEGCNQSKNDRPAATWLASKFGKRKAAVILARIEAYFASLTDHYADTLNFVTRKVKFRKK